MWSKVPSDAREIHATTPSTCKMVLLLPPKYVPEFHRRLLPSSADLPNPVGRDDDFEKEVAETASGVVDDDEFYASPIVSRVKKASVEHFREDVGSASMFFLGCVGSFDAFERWATTLDVWEDFGEELSAMFAEIVTNMRNTPDEIVRDSVEIFLNVRARTEYETRYATFLALYLRLPFYLVRADAPATVFSAHHSKTWSRVYAEKLAPYSKMTPKEFAERTRTTRADVVLVCSALKKFPRKSFPATNFQKWFVEEMEYDEVPDDVGVVALALITPWPTKVFDVMGWWFTKDEKSRMSGLIERGFTLSVDEALRVTLA